jgi:hypothetical protein
MSETQENQICGGSANSEYGCGKTVELEDMEYINDPECGQFVCKACYDKAVKDLVPQGEDDANAEHPIYCPIPESESPYGANAFQMPDKDDIAFIEGKDFCYMKVETFNKLLEYSTSLPSGVWVGKLWKAHRQDGNWYLMWYDKVNEEGKCPVGSKRIYVTNDS